METIRLDHEFVGYHPFVRKARLVAELDATTGVKGDCMLLSLLLLVLLTLMRLVGVEKTIQVLGPDPRHHVGQKVSRKFGRKEASHGLNVQVLVHHLRVDRHAGECARSPGARGVHGLSTVHDEKRIS